MGLKATSKKIGKNKVIRIILYPVIKIYRWNKINSHQKYLNNTNKIFDKIFSRVVPNPILVELSEFEGTFEVDIRSDIFRRIALEGSYELDLIKIMAQYLEKEKDAIDIGANIGLFSVYFAKNINENCKVLSIEPTPNAYKLLINNVTRNSCSNKIIFYNGALSDSEGKVTINFVEGKEEYSSIGKINSDYIGHIISNKISVQTTTLDKLVEQYNIKPGFIKIDTEGAELLVLKGALETLEKFHPIILSELCDNLLKELNNSAKEVIDLLKSHNYKVIDIKNPHSKIKYPFSGEILALPKI